MHMLGEPRTMQLNPTYEDVVSDVKAFLEERLAFAMGEGIAEEKVWLDPGIGFGKTVEHNLELLRRLDELVAIGRPIVIGTSRKSFLGKLTGSDVAERLAGHDRDQRARARARRHHLPRARRGGGGRRSQGGRCYGRLAHMDEPEHLEPDEDEEEDEGGPLVTVEVVGLSLYTHHGVERRRARGGTAAGV